MNRIAGTIIDLVGRKIFKGSFSIENGKITDLREENHNETQIILPGFIDSHIHIESSMLVPAEFARIASCHGTVAALCDPHEIANVLGTEGIQFMIENGKKSPFKFFFGAPSCVPATNFESAGAIINAEEIEKLLQSNEIYFLAEMMNFPGTIAKDPEILKKINAAKRFQKPIDGHAPCLRGNDLKTYCKTGITTDHECSSLEEAIEKIKLGMAIQIREGSAARNFEALLPLFKNYPQKLFFCSDDKHPDDLLHGHINRMVHRAISKGYDIFDVLSAATLNPAKHYKLNVGMLQNGDPADFIIIDNFENFKIKSTFINGNLVAENGNTKLPHSQCNPPNNFNIPPISHQELFIKDEGKPIQIIEAHDGQLLTSSFSDYTKSQNGNLISDPDKDILKITVINRYQKSPPAIGFIKNFGLKKGAIASSIAHDSHNIIALGCSDEEIAAAINNIIQNRGGITTYTKGESLTLPLPVAGIMSTDTFSRVAECYEKIDSLAKKCGSKLQAPFMTLSFMALLVIPELKLSDKGLFNTNKFCFTPLQI